MRVVLLAVTLMAAASLSACGKKEAAGDGQVAATEPSSAPASAAIASPPKRKAGLWEQTMTAEGKSTVMKMCTDEAFESKVSFVANNAMPGVCNQTVTPAAGGGWSFTSTCDMGSGGKTVSEGTASGDFASKYEVKARSTTTGAQVPQMNRSSEMTLVAVYKGACPEGWAAGDVEMPGVGKISTAGMMAKMEDRVAKAAPSK